MGSDCPAPARPCRPALRSSRERADDAGTHFHGGTAAFMSSSALPAELPPDIFRSIAWGQDSVMEATRQRLAAHHLRWSEPRFAVG